MIDTVAVKVREDSNEFLKAATLDIGERFRRLAIRRNIIITAGPKGNIPRRSDVVALLIMNWENTSPEMREIAEIEFLGLFCKDIEELKGGSYGRSLGYDSGAEQNGIILSD